MDPIIQGLRRVVHHGKSLNTSSQLLPCRTFLYRDELVVLLQFKQSILRSKSKEQLSPTKSLSWHHCCLCFGWSCVKRVQELHSSQPPLKIPLCLRCLSSEASRLKPSKLDSNHEIWAEFNFKRQQYLQAPASSLLARPHYRRPSKSSTQRAKNKQPPLPSHTSAPQLQATTPD